MREYALGALLGALCVLGFYLGIHSGPIMTWLSAVLQGR